MSNEVHTPVDESRSSGQDENTSPACPWYARTWVRLAVCFVFVTTVPLVVTAIYTTHRHIAVIRDVAVTAASDRVDQSARRLEEILSTARSDLLALAEWPIWESYQAADTEHDRQFWRDKLIIQLRTFADLKPLYQSLVYADASGRDSLRLTRSGTVATVHGTDTPLSSLEKSVLTRTAQLAPRQTYWEFVKSDGVLTMLCTARIASRGAQTWSAIWLELDGASLLADCTLDEARATSLALYDDRGLLRFSSTDSAPEALSIERPRQYVDSAGQLVSVASVSMFPGQGQQRWRLASFEDATRLDAGVRDFRAAFLSVLGLALLIATLLSVWLARQFSQPLRRVYHASQRIGRGEFDVDLSDMTGDEIGALAEQVDIMAGKLRAAHEDFERRLSEKTEQLVHAERLSTIGRTAAAVAHEINNPSGIISMYAQMLTERLPAGHPNLEKIRVIKAKAREISRIVNELLDYSRKPAPKKEWVDSKMLITRAVHDARAVASDGAASASITHRICVEPDAEKVFVDPHQMGRVLRNLVNNACQAMASGGELTLTSRPADGGGVAMEIADTGAGMDAEQLRHLFDPFYTTKRFGAGTGLGLAISKEITERHGGSINVRSAPGEGTTVTIWLPEPPEMYEI